MKFYVVKEGRTADFLAEPEALAGVRDICGVVAEDLRAVSDCLPVQRESVSECGSDRVILAATVGNSPLLDGLEREGRISLAALRGRREVYLMQLLDSPFPGQPGIRQALVIAGSDKRGTIYGLFRLSELCGVSPLIFWGDAAPMKNPEPCVLLEKPFVSKEPSVKYRGFFINDEWPAFGNWCVERYGGVNAAAYRKIFELLLRLKGNYLWPAMWRSSFSEDGPGLANAELADRLGIIMGTSHHEPMCRAGVEWQNQYRRYGNDSAWSFLSNAEAITGFWEEGILRNRPFENVVTIGMRGENDSKLLPPDATMRDNVGVLKKAIRTQHMLLKKHLSEDLKQVPRMLAVYKEVEDYYFGDETCEGLEAWDELSDVIFLLSDDNYGNVRALPSGGGKKHPGGYGMYYHFDYHGAPVSYEWQNTNRLTKIWEQMTTAYEAGVREMWIVNVGDLKGVEYPLCYFMELAYDFERWGSTALNQTEAFARGWIRQQFGAGLSAEQEQTMFEVIEGYTRWNAIRTPEAMNADIFHPVHFREGDRVREQIQTVMEKAEQLNRELSGPSLTAYHSMIYYPAAASLNLMLMYLDAGQNRKLAERGCVGANLFAARVAGRIAADSRYAEEYHRANGGKWNHCMSSAHTGFRSWDDKDWGYPAVQTVAPIPGGKAVVSFRGSETYHLGAHWQDRGPLRNDDFTRPDTEEVLLDIDSRGKVSFSYEAEYDRPWLLCPERSGRVEAAKDGRSTLRFGIDRRLLQGRDSASVTLRISFDDGTKTESKLLLEAEELPFPASQSGGWLFAERQGYCAIAAEHFSEQKDVDGKGFRVVSYLGREGAAVKAFPQTEAWPDAEKAPYLRYDLIVGQTGVYCLELFLLARNPAERGGRMRFAVSANDGAVQELCAVSEQYYTEWFCPEWSDGVLRHGRTVKTEVSLRQGENHIYVYAKEPGVALEKLAVYPANTALPQSYLGPAESYGRKCSLEKAEQEGEE